MAAIEGHELFLDAVGFQQSVEASGGGGQVGKEDRGGDDGGEVGDEHGCGDDGGFDRGIGEGGGGGDERGNYASGVALLGALVVEWTMKLNMR